MKEGFVELLGDYRPQLWVGLLVVIKIVLMLTDKSNFKSSKLSKNVYDALDKLYDDREFLRNFVSILKKEDNLKEMINDILIKYKVDVHRFHTIGLILILKNSK
jgi:hypothetical protein